jgi:mono/diheme cytochrome c family protein
MSKSDEELLNSIREGFSGKIGVMPRWKNRLSEEEMVSVLQYIRETFGKPAE